MPQRPHLSVSMTRGEQIAGWVYLPFYLLIVSAVLGAVATLLGYDIEDQATLAWVNLIYGAINFLAIVVMFRRFLTESLLPVARQPLRALGYAVVGLSLYYVGTSLATLLVTALDPGLQNANNEAVMDMAGQNLRAMIVFTILLAPMTEEVLFRGVIFGSLHRRSRAAAYIVSVLAFSALHVIGFIGTQPVTTLLLSLLQYVPASIALAWVYERADTIWTPILAHMMANGLSMTALHFLEQMQ